MSLHKKLSQLNIEALREVLLATEKLISYQKNTEPHIWNHEDNGCLGYPAAILLFAYIESVGCILLDDSGEKSFIVLRHPVFGNQPISESGCKSVYKIYRNRLMHNLGLPKNARLFSDHNNLNAFDVANAGKKKQEVVTAINLYALLYICKSSFEKLKEKHEAHLDSSRIMSFISNDDLENNINTQFSSTVTPSGICSPDIFS
jgi:hypothetical protein